MVSSRWVLALSLVCAVGCRTADPDRYGADLEPPTASLPQGAGDETVPPRSAAETLAPTTPPSLDLAPFRGAHTFAGAPRGDLALTLLTNLGYAVGYSEGRKNPLWACYRVTAAAPHAAGKRPSRFKVDERTGARVAHTDYKQADYQENPAAFDRGHMAPNHAIATRYGREAQLETFYMSNICPQQKRLNQQTWAALEQRIAGPWAEAFGELWVAVGPIFGQEPERLNGVAEIPEAFYALVLDEDSGEVRVLALVMGQAVSGSRPLGEFVTSVDAVEAATGLDFFGDLPDALEDVVERATADARWQLAPAHRD